LPPEISEEIFSPRFCLRSIGDIASGDIGGDTVYVGGIGGDTVSEDIGGGDTVFIISERYCLRNISYRCFDPKYDVHHGKGLRSVSYEESSEGV